MISHLKAMILLIQKIYLTNLGTHVVATEHFEIFAEKFIIVLPDGILHSQAISIGKADFGGPFCFVRYRVTSQ